MYEDVYRQVTSTDMMRKYHNLGTPANLQGLNDIQSLPWRNLQQSSDPGIATITGTSFADETLLRNGACSGCPVGCIHIGFIREKMQDNRYHYNQVAYDYEPIFAAGTMLGITNSFDVLRILDVMEKVCLDAMSGGVALAWATEAMEKGLISTKETLVPLRFGDAGSYLQAANIWGVEPTIFTDFWARVVLKRPKYMEAEILPVFLARKWPVMPLENYFLQPNPWVSGIHTWIRGPIVTIRRILQKM